MVSSEQETRLKEENFRLKDKVQLLVKKIDKKDKKNLKMRKEFDKVISSELSDVTY